MIKQEAIEIMNETKQSYNLIATEFSDTRHRVWPEMEILVKKYVKYGDKVLDAGCGNARLAGVLNKVEYWGLDSSSRFLSNLKFKNQNLKNGKINLKNLDLLELDKFEQDDFDIVFMFASFNHIAGREFRLKVLNDVYQLLKPGGFVIMTNWNMWNLVFKKNIWRYKFSYRSLNERYNLSFRDIMTRWQLPDRKKQAELYYRAFSKSEIKALLRKTGFKVVQNYYSFKGKRAYCWNGSNLVSVAQKSA